MLRENETKRTKIDVLLGVPEDFGEVRRPLLPPFDLTGQTEERLLVRKKIHPLTVVIQRQQWPVLLFERTACNATSYESGN